MVDLKALLAPIAEAPERLLDDLAIGMTNDRLEEIARADYGTDFDRHLAQLKRLRAREPIVWGWEPVEVLELFRWSEYGDDRTGQTKRSKTDFHRMRAFCCANLLAAGVAPGGQDAVVSSNETVIQLIDSVAAIDDGIVALLPAFLAWETGALPEADGERGHHCLGLIGALVMAGRIDDPVMPDVIGAVFALDAEMRATWRGGVGSHADHLVLGTTHHGQRNARWIALAERIGAAAGTASNPDVQTRLLDLVGNIVKP